MILRRSTVGAVMDLTISTARGLLASTVVDLGMQVVTDK